MPTVVAVNTPNFSQFQGAVAVEVKRDIRAIMQEIKAMAAYAGTDWFYRYPVKNRRENRTDWIEGPSVKLANAVAAIYGNCRMAALPEFMADGVIIHAVFHDIEKGFVNVRPFVQKQGTGRIGGDDDSRRADMSMQIAISKATRNVIVNSLGYLTDFAFDEARNSLVKKIGERMDWYRTEIVERSAQYVTIDRIEALIGKPVREWLAPDIARIITMVTAIADGMASVDDTFPPLHKPTNKTAGDLDQFADNSSPPKTSPMQRGGEGDKAATPGPHAEGSLSSPQTESDTNVNTGDGSETASVDAPATAGVSADTKRELIDKVLAIATDKDLSIDQRQQALDMAQDDWHQALPNAPAFVRQCFQTAAAVAKGEMKVDAARKYLTSMGGKS